MKTVLLIVLLSLNWIFEDISFDLPKPAVKKINKTPMDDPKCLLRIKNNEKIARNEKCLATGKKFKHCCGFL